MTTQFPTTSISAIEPFQFKTLNPLTLHAQKVLNQKQVLNVMSHLRSLAFQGIQTQRFGSNVS